MLQQSPQVYLIPQATFILFHPKVLILSQGVELRATEGWKLSHAKKEYMKMIGKELTSVTIQTPNDHTRTCFTADA